MTDIGLFGGTFDPVHHGHLQCAAAARAEAGIDHIVFIPSARPPHKNRDGVGKFIHRLSMLEIALKPFEYCSVSDLERERSHPSYTIETWNIFRKNAPPSTNHFFIIGCDAFLDIKTWYHWQAVIAHIDFIILIRPGYNTSILYAFLDQNGFSVADSRSAQWFNLNGSNSIKLLTTRTDDISSSEIRRRIRQNLPWKHLVEKDVGAYILEHSLYR